MFGHFLKEIIKVTEQCNIYNEYNDCFRNFLFVKKYTKIGSSTTVLNIDNNQQILTNE